jgi:multidrug efflux pump subunit AcrB
LWSQINKTVCKKEFQVKLRTFHQLKTNDFDDGGLDDHWGLQFSFQEKKNHKCVPMADVMVGYPGASPTEVESRVAKPLEKIISNIKVEHIHTMAMNGQALIVQFYKMSNDRMSNFMTNSPNTKICSRKECITYGKTRSIDDVPMLGITLWSDKMDDFQLRQIAEEVTSEIEK